MHGEGEGADEDAAAGCDDWAVIVSSGFMPEGLDLHVDELYIFALDHFPATPHQL